MEKKTKLKTKNNNKKNKKKTKKIKNLIQEYEYEFQTLKEKYNNSNKTEKDQIIFEEISTRLLLKLDSIETQGQEYIRAQRKTLVMNINLELDEIKN